MDKKLIAEIIVFCVLLYALYTLLQKVGVFKSAETDAAEKGLGTVGDSLTALDPQTFFKKYPLKKTDKPNFAKINFDVFARGVKNAKGFFNDNEDALFGIFRDLPTQKSVAFLAMYFNSVYKIDMGLYMDGFMSDSDVAKISNIINRKKIS